MIVLMGFLLWFSVGCIITKVIFQAIRVVVLEKENKELREENAGLRQLLEPRDKQKELDVYRGNDTRPLPTRIPTIGVAQH